MARQVSALLPRRPRARSRLREGRDSVFFAERGFDVTGVDIARFGTIPRPSAWRASGAYGCAGSW